MSDERELLEKVKKKADDTFASLSSLWASYQILKLNSEESFNECISKIANSNSQASQKITELTEKTKNENEKLNSHKDYLYAQARSMATSIKEIKDSLIKMTAEYEDLRTLIREIEKRSQASINDIHRVINDKIAAAKKEINDKIEQLPIVKDALSADQVRSQIAHQIEPSSLDARNALLNMRNHEIRLTVAEKKVEGLILQMRNMELGQ